MSDPLDFDTALPAQGLDAPHKLATSHTLSVGQKCPTGNRKRGPNEYPRQGYRHNNFVIPGITFHVFVGQRLDRGLRLGCAARSPERMILLSNEMNDRMLQSIASMVARSRVVGTLRGE